MVAVNRLPLDLTNVLTAKKNLHPIKDDFSPHIETSHLICLTWFLCDDNVVLKMD